MRNVLAPGVKTLLLPRIHTHSLGCESQTEPEFRQDISGLFRAPAVVTYEDIARYVERNYEEIDSLALTYDETIGYANPVNNNPGSNFVSMNRSDCMLAYISGKLLAPFARQAHVFGVLMEFTATQLLDGFWHLMLHWADVASTAWPVLHLLEYLEADVRRQHHRLPTSEDLHGRLPVKLNFDHQVGSMAPELRAAVAAEAPPWGMMSAQLFALPPHPFSAASAHLALALALLDGGQVEVSWQVEMLLTLALLWMRSARTKPSPMLQLIHTSWPVLPLWGRVWRHPRTMEFLRHTGQCPAVFDPIWELRRLRTAAMVRALPGAVWPIVRAEERRLETQGARASASASREAWATAICVAPGGGGESRAWVDAIRVLHASVRRHEPSGNRRPFLIAVEAGLDEDYADAFRADGMELVALEPLVVPEIVASCPPVQRRAEGLRFRLFGLTAYDRIVYLDADALVVGPIAHLFTVPRGVQLMATINGTRWAYRKGSPVQSEWALATATATFGPPLVNTGVMVISPGDEFIPAVLDVIAIDDWDYKAGWLSCDDALQKTDIARHVCLYTSLMSGFCTQGLIDAVLLAKGSRLGAAVWGRRSASGPSETFLGCTAPDQRSSPGGALVEPRPWVDHCVLSEAYNLQVTRPHLGWHMPFMQDLSKHGDVVRVIHWPGRPKPWRLLFGQRTEWEQLWWELHANLCEATTATARTQSEQCWLTCGG